MKNFKFIFILLLFSMMVPFTVMAFGQEPEVPDPETVKFGDFFLTLASALIPVIILGALATAANHIMAGTFKLKPWWDDTALPSLIAYIVALLLGIIDHQYSVLDGFVEMVFNIKTDVDDVVALAGIAWIFVPIVKGLFKAKDTKAKVAAKKLSEATL